MSANYLKGADVWVYFNGRWLGKLNSISHSVSRKWLDSTVPCYIMGEKDPVITYAPGRVIVAGSLKPVGEWELSTEPGQLTVLGINPAGQAAILTFLDWVPTNVHFENGEYKTFEFIAESTTGWSIVK